MKQAIFAFIAIAAATVSAHADIFKPDLPNTNATVTISDLGLDAEGFHVFNVTIKQIAGGAGTVWLDSNGTNDKIGEFWTLPIIGGGGGLRLAMAVPAPGTAACLGIGIIFTRRKR